ncbi:hypothetical protein [Demequina lutea]|uniref:Xylulose 5-phosphate/Fructose 6-phosphate phosphoketolase N-terminal domain-containing protein n=1 Tax=Demequina lutea TaxID=431489 RepID=A0A7Y9Z8Q3_9MICO|nr:hypothetical protein [Demequina lutea]NYI40686.1 hypothetical protein [Demequina lutea]
MSALISSWVAHANREPSDLLLDVMDSWLTEGMLSDSSVDSCPWLSSELHRLILVHVDRAAHKRRHMPTFVSTRPCGLVDHGDGPMSTIVRDDVYGQQPLSVLHSAPETALAHAINLVKERDSALAVALVTESEFEDPDRFDSHRGVLLSPLRDGVVVAVIHAPLHAKENLDDETAREDLLRAAGYAAYTLDLAREEDPRHLHKRMAALLEDIFDEITQIKADAAARILSSNPLWPALVVRTSPEWRTRHGEPLVTDQIPLAASH